MRVKMLTLSAGPQGVREIGKVVDVSDAEGQNLVKGRFAVAVDAEGKEIAPAPPAPIKPAEKAENKPAAEKATADPTKGK